MLHLNTNPKPWSYFALLACILLYSSCGDETYISVPQNACDLPYNELSISCDFYNVEFSNLGQGWVTFVGDGNELRIAAYSFGSFMDYIRLYTGDNCNNLTLIASSNQNESEIEFQSVDGQRYFVEMIDSYGDESIILICNDNDAPNNDVCIDAIEWRPNTRLLGSLTHASNTALPPECLQDNSKGVWYSLQGDGQAYNFNLMKAELGGFGSNIGTETFHFNIYEGDCSNLVCVLGNSSLGPVTFTPLMGKTYYIYVTIRTDTEFVDAYDNFIFSKSTCVDLIDGFTVESCPGSNKSKVKVTTTQSNVTFGYISIVDLFSDGFEYAFIAGSTENGPLTNNNGNFTITAPLKGYVVAFVGDDLRSALCWDYVYFDITGNEPDLTPPVAMCRDHILELNQQGMATLEVSMINKNSSDNCGIVMRTLSETNFDCDDLGDHTITLTVEDAAGLTASCTSTVTVVDNLPPTPQCNNLTVTLDEDGIKNLLVDQIDNGSSDNCSVQTLQLNPPIVDCDDAMIGGGTVQLTVTDNSGNTNSCTAVITVTDVTPPMANCMDATVSLDNNGEGTLNPSDIDNNSSDACGIQDLSLDNTTFTCTDIGQNNSVTLTVTDNNGNTSNCNAMVTVIDDLPPTAVCKNTTVEIQPNGLYVLTEADVYDAINSSDNCAIDAVSFPATIFSCDDLDLTIPITLTLTDASANMANCNALITVALGDALPNEWDTSDIGQVTIGNAYSFDPCANDDPATGEFTITGSGNNAIGTTSDNIAFAHQSLCGDGSITAKIESVTPNGYGGLSIRETNASNSKQVSIFSNLTNVLRHETRYLINANKVVQAFFKSSPFWLKLERQGDWFFAYYSSTGSNFQYVHGVYVPMQQCVEIGMASFTYQPYAQTEAVFSNVTIGTGNNVFSVSEEVPEIKPYEAIPNLELSIFPNPTDHSFSIVFENPVESSTTLQLYNSFGQLVGIQHLESGANRIDWEIEHLPEGVYLISDDKKSFVKQLIISK